MDTNSLHMRPADVPTMALHALKTKWPTRSTFLSHAPCFQKQRCFVQGSGAFFGANNMKSMENWCNDTDGKTAVLRDKQSHSVNHKPHGGSNRDFRGEDWSEF